MRARIDFPDEHLRSAPARRVTPAGPPEDLDGRRRITVFERGTARLVAHEIYHLNGVLYTDRMQQGRQPIPVGEYHQSGRTWSY
jgi:hypothetical protein